MWVMPGNEPANGCKWACDWDANEPADEHGKAADTDTNACKSMQMEHGNIRDLYHYMSFYAINYTLGIGRG